MINLYRPSSLNKERVHGNIVTTSTSDNSFSHTCLMVQLNHYHQFSFKLGTSHDDLQNNFVWSLKIHFLTYKQLPNSLIKGFNHELINIMGE